MTVLLTEQDIDTLITFHESGLQQYRYAMSPSAIYLEEQTIKALQQLRQIIQPTGETPWGWKAKE